MKPVFSLIASLILISAAQAQFSQLQLVQSNEELSVYTSVSYDYEDDGDEDILFSHSGYKSGAVLMLRNKGNWEFEEDRILLPGIDNIDRIYTIDWDQDGDKDLMLDSDESIYWIENLPGGHHRSHFLGYSSAFIHPINSVFVDFDLDGDLDHMASSRGNVHNLSYQPNNNGFTYPPTSLLEVPGCLYLYFKVLDFDKNGLPDVVSLDDDSESFQLFKNTGNGTFDRIDAFDDLESTPQFFDVITYNDKPYLIFPGSFNKIVLLPVNTNGFGNDQIINNSIPFRDLYAANIDEDPENEILLPGDSLRYLEIGDWTNQHIIMRFPHRFVSSVV